MKTNNLFANSIYAITKEAESIESEAERVSIESERFSQMAENYSKEVLNAIKQMHENIAQQYQQEENSKEVDQYSSSNSTPQKNNLIFALNQLKISLDRIDTDIFNKNDPSLAKSYNDAKDDLESVILENLQKMLSSISKDDQNDLISTLSYLESCINYFDHAMDNAIARGINSDLEQNYRQYKDTIGNAILDFLDTTQNMLKGDSSSTEENNRA